MTRTIYNSILIICRGIGQVIFQENALSGAIMLLGLFLGSPWVGVYALLGTSLSSLTAHLAAWDKESIRRGLYGFNGTLVGVIIGLSCPLGWASLLVLICGSILSSLLARLLARQTLLPGLTAPFVLLGYALIFIALLHPYFVRGSSLDTRLIETLDLLKCNSLSFGQIMLQGDKLVVGILFLLAIACNSRKMALEALVASLLCLLLALCLPKANMVHINAGLYGYNGILSFLAIASVLPIKTWRYAKAILALVLATLMQHLGLRYGFPTLTLPFVLSVWLIALLETKVSSTAKA